MLIEIVVGQNGQALSEKRKSEVRKRWKFNAMSTFYIFQLHGWNSELETHLPTCALTRTYSLTRSLTCSFTIYTYIRIELRQLYRSNNWIMRLKEESSSSSSSNSSNNRQANMWRKWLCRRNKRSPYQKTALLSLNPCHRSVVKANQFCLS